ncbi:hypothetical protein SECTIM467_168 [Brevibacillus phage SecTim467]|uniref:Uncharacterized protein n=2 Tax=Jenstvirus jenst TaxID=1982225 RepID=A0A0K2CNY6_9CAUD|nr:hypothetical protein AVV11_gp028 [Brevibacillus phage Jenst]ALA07292.1 hypothetical protein JENST_163 [Brevibacillus phage Jenst]ALA07491.1 hypothetical protein SECTIM467_168 [Brevibacillus phage SecTim467]
MITNFGARRIIGYWEVDGKRVECISLYSDPNSFKDEVSVRYADGSKSAWLEVVHGEDGKMSVTFDGHTLYINEIKGEDV